jgi:hypothetical protein
MTAMRGNPYASGSVLSNREAAERIMRMLKRTALFAPMSWRLLADFVMAFPLRSIDDATGLVHVDFAVLAVPEHRLLLSDAPHPHPMPSEPAGIDRVAELTSGIHMRHNVHVRRFSRPHIAAPRGRTVRYFSVERKVIPKLPAHVTRAMDFEALLPEDIEELLPPEDRRPL